MAISRVRLTFTDDNHGANEADGYKIYRKVGSDPCPGGVIDPANLHETVAGITTGSQVQWTDMTADASTNYYYRASFYRGADESLSQMAVGPVAFPSTDDLGYPNNSPAHDSGVQNFISVEPLYHLDVEKMHGRHGTGLLTNGTDNEANTHSQFKTVGSTSASHAQHIIMWDKGGTMPAIPTMDTEDSVHVYSSRQNHLDATSILPLASTAPRLIGVFDEGYTLITVFKSSAKTGGYSTSWTSNKSYCMDFKTRLMSGYAYTDTYNVSDGQPWTHPDMPAWQAASPTSGGNDYSNKWLTGTKELTLTYQGASYLQDWSRTRAASIPDINNHNDLILKIDHVDPDGSHRIFYNGSLAADWQGTPEHIGYVGTENGDNQPFKLYPMYEFRNASDIYQQQMLYGQCMRVEQLLMPKKISNEDILRAAAYLNDKYDGYLATQSNYAGL